MEDIKRLNSARDHIHSGRIDEGVKECLELVALGSAEAPDYLGILYYSGLGVPEDKEKAAEYFLLSHNRGYAMGTYHLAGEYRRKSKIHESLELSKSIADINPSSSYWVFRGLCELYPDQTRPGSEAEKYLLQAARMGHIEALIIVAKRTMKGYYGLSKIPDGIRQYFQIIALSQKTMRNRERLKYIDSLHRRGFMQFEQSIEKRKQAVGSAGPAR